MIKRIEQLWKLIIPLTLVLSLFMTSLAAAEVIPTIASDLPDYAPGDIVTLYGAGWQAGEVVHIFVNDDIDSTWSRSVDVTAAEDGSFTDIFELPSWFVAVYSVTATGSSGLSASTTFTDAAIKYSPVRYPAIGWMAVSAGSKNDLKINATKNGRWDQVVYGFAVANDNGVGNPTCGNPPGGASAGVIDESWVQTSATFPKTITSTATEFPFMIAPPIPTAAGYYRGIIKFTLNSTGLQDGAGTAVCVQVINTPPTVTVTGVTEDFSYEIGSVPEATCQVSDVNDGDSSFAATLSEVTGPLADYGLGDQTASCSYIDAGLLPASASVTYHIVDTTDPVITYVSRTAANANGWNKDNVTVTWSCSDSGSGPVSNTVIETVSTEGYNQEVTGTCVDHAGNTASDKQGGINIDKTPPTVSLVGGPAAGGSFYFGFVPAAPTCTASDALSDLDGPCLVSGYSGLVGSHTVTASATDKAGNSATSAPLSYTVLPWRLSGFYAPVDMGGVYNLVKGGSTVPLKFEVFAATELMETSVVKSFVSTSIPCDSTIAVDAIEVTTTGITSLRYDTVEGQFIQNWQTPKKAGACYKVTMTTQDGTQLAAFFKLK